MSMQEVLDQNERLYKLNEKLVNDKRRLTNALNSLRLVSGCFCAPVHVDLKQANIRHSKICISVREALGDK